mmetsp:Transcript_13464/g.31645  ORF Transcript_13464/g.31645 Transcript_13464/m.31645 type:complete len:572 (+) Transcript_13464:208-1923(+)
MNSTVSIVPDTSEDLSGGEACQFNEAPNEPTVPAFGFCVSKGRRTDNEDRVSVTPCLLGRPGQNFYGVYDGHCGPRAADFSKVDIPTRIKHAMQNYPQGIPPDAALRMLTTTFKETDASFCASAGIMEDGTTACVVLLSGLDLYCADCGDSRALLCRMGAPIPLSKEHKPDDKAEKARIERAGGEVKTVGGLPRVNGVLATSRAIGDNHLKPMIIPDPYVSHRRLTKGDDFVVLGSDGLFDYVGPNTICQTVMNSVDAKSAAETLVKLAIHHGSFDNVSAVVVDCRTFFQDRNQSQMLQNTKVTPLNMPQRIKSMADKLVSGVDLFALPEEHSGWLCKQSRSSLMGQRWQKRWFVLHAVTGQAGADFSVHKGGMMKSVVFVLHYHDSQEQSLATNPRKPIFIDPAMGVNRETHLDKPDQAVISFFEATSGAAFLVAAPTTREADLWAGKCEASFAKHGFHVADKNGNQIKKPLVRSLSEMEEVDPNQVKTHSGEQMKAPEGIVSNGQFTGPLQLERSDTGGLQAIGGGWHVTATQMAGMDMNTMGFPRAGFVMTEAQTQAFGLPAGSAVVR